MFTGMHPKQGRYALFLIILLCAAITITQDLYEHICVPLYAQYIIQIHFFENKGSEK